LLATDYLGVHSLLIALPAQTWLVSFEPPE
jgi:hypothetical protein